VVGFGVTELHRRQPITVDGEMDERGIGVEALAEHDHRLAVRVPVAEKSGGGGDGEVAGHLARDVVELIRSAPDVGAGAGDLVLSGCRIELRGSLQRRRADVVGPGEDAQRPGSCQPGLRCAGLVCVRGGFRGVAQS
jgi:hypothetical protein